MQHHAVWREYWSRLVDERAKRGMYIEVACPIYEDDSLKAIQNIRDFREDTVLWQKAEMLLDLTYALIAQETTSNGVRGAPRAGSIPLVNLLGGVGSNVALISSSTGRKYSSVRPQ